MRKQRGYLNITTLDMLAFLAIVIVAGGYIVYVALPWFWRVAIKPLLLWMLT